MSTHEIFLKKLKEKNHSYRNGEFEVIGEYKCSKCKIIVKGSGCPKCVNKYSYSEKDYRNKLIKKYGYSFNFDKTKYINSNTDITITCPIHGDFEQNPKYFYKTGNCPKCSNLKKGWTYYNWCNQCGDNPGIFYVLRCWNEDEEFYKVGITCQDSVDKRYRGYSSMPYSYEVVNYIKSENRETIWELEKTYKKLFKQYKYRPQIKFGGISECYKFY